MGRGRRKGRRRGPRVAHRRRHVRGKTRPRGKTTRARSIPAARVPPSRGRDVRGHRVGAGHPRRPQNRGGSQRHAPAAGVPRVERREGPSGRRRVRPVCRRGSRLARRAQARRTPRRRRGRRRRRVGRRGGRDATRRDRRERRRRRRRSVRAGPREFTGYAVAGTRRGWRRRGVF